MKKSVIEQERTRLIRKYHTLANKALLSPAAREGILAGYGVESSADLSVAELIQLCAQVEGIATEYFTEQDKWRKRLYAAIATYLRLMRKPVTDAEIKAIACRAAGMEDSRDFNKIPKDRLCSLYNAFNNRNRDIQMVNKISYYDNE